VAANAGFVKEKINELIDTRYMKSVSVITPCRDEEKFIARCLDSIIANDFPKDNLEVLVIDGRSTDETREIVGKYAAKYDFIKLMDNPGMIQTLATNIGIMSSHGDLIMRMDAHVGYPHDFISKAVGWIEKSGSDCVGGIVMTMPGSDTTVAQAIAFVLSHPFGVGNNYFRIGLKKPKYVDTVPFGCYKKEVFDKVGLFNENLNRTDDIEFNLRLKRAGGKLLLVPEIVSYYFARPDLKGLFKQNFGNGFWVLYSLKFAKIPFSVRHLIPLVFVLSLFGSFTLSFFCQPFAYLFAFIAGLYLIVNSLFSLKLSVKHGLKYLPALIVSFAVLHVSYGFGSLWGIAKLITSMFRSKKEF
jgi:glycosyltransferase involved in cell wall biosynthesis